MDKETLSNYGWVVICIIVLCVMIALATPFGNYIKGAALGIVDALTEKSEVFGDKSNDEESEINQSATGGPTLGKSSFTKFNYENMPETIIFTNKKPSDSIVTVSLAEGANPSDLIGWMDGTTMYISNQNTEKDIKLPSDCSSLFAFYDEPGDTYNENFNLKSIKKEVKIDASNVVNMYNMFYNCSSLTDISALKNWDVSKVENMRGTFTCYQLSDITPLKTWKTSSLTDAYSAFSSTKITELSSLKNWDMSKVEWFAEMFCNCSELNDISALENWDISSAYTMALMFDSCTNLTDISALKNWDVSKINELYCMFASCTSLTDVSSLKNWSIANGCDISDMFYHVPATPLPSWY